MSWELLPTNFVESIWVGLKKYTLITNPDDTVSLQDVTDYIQREHSFFNSNHANRMNEALNIIMSMVEQGTDLYEAFKIYFEQQKILFEQFSKEQLAQWQIDEIKRFEEWWDSVRDILKDVDVGELLMLLQAMQSQIDHLETIRFDIKAEPNANITITDGSDTFTGIADSSGLFVQRIPRYGTWTLTASLGSETTTTNVNVDNVRIYNISLMFIDITLNVTAPNGSLVTVVEGATSLSAIAVGGLATFRLPRFGTWQITATLAGETASTTLVVNEERVFNITLAFLNIEFVIAVEPGSTVNITDGISNLFYVAATDELRVNVPRFGTWNFKATLGSEESTATVVVTAEGTFSVNLLFAMVFGVEWDWSNPSTVLRRLTRANDPNRFVTRDITTEPVAAVGTGAGSSPFDAFFPWAGMDEFNIINNAVSHRRGEPGFSRTANDTVVRIPKFWYHIEQHVPSTRMRFYVSDKPYRDFRVHEAFNRGDGIVRDNVYYAKYDSVRPGTTPQSISGVATPRSTSFATAQSESRNKGANWWLTDYAISCALQLLLLVEFANWNVRNIIGTGHRADTIASGATDLMNYHTGRATTAVGSTMRYRWIENFYGGIQQWTEGIRSANHRISICLNPQDFETPTRYIDTGITRAATGWITRFGVSSDAPFAFICTAVGGSSTTFVADESLGAATNTNIGLLGGFGGSGNIGAFGMNTGATTTITGGRLMFLPPN